jgi:hypothetical protein
MNEQINVDLSKSTAEKCDKCKHPFFMQVFQLRKISRFATGSPQDAMVPMPTFACANCGHVNEGFVRVFPQDGVDDAEEITDKSEE